MKPRELLNKLRRSPMPEEDERSSGSVDDAFTVGSAKNPASWIPSQQDGPRH